METLKEKKELDLKEIVQKQLDKSRYFQDVVKKNQIVIHHTAGGPSANNVIHGWNVSRGAKVATCVVVSGKGKAPIIDGQIVQCFSSKNWAYHLGISKKVFSLHKVAYSNLDKHAIGIEICNYGQLKFVDGKYYNIYNGEVKPEEVTTLETPYKGHKYFHKYTDAQIESVRQLLKYWGRVYMIDLTFDYEQLFTVNKKALKGENGLYTHNSYRTDKVDAYPCPRLIKMLKEL